MVALILVLRADITILSAEGTGLRKFLSTCSFSAKVVALIAVAVLCPKRLHLIWFRKDRSPHPIGCGGLVFLVMKEGINLRHSFPNRQLVAVYVFKSIT